MATLIAHSQDPAASTFAEQLADILRDHRGVTIAVEEFAQASRYVPNVEAVIVVAEAEDETFHRAARNFMAAQHADMAGKSLFIAALGHDGELSDTQLAAMHAFRPRDTAYFRLDVPDADAVIQWVGQIHSRGAV